MKLGEYPQYCKYCIYLTLLPTIKNCLRNCFVRLCGSMWTYFWKKKSFRRRRLGCDFTSLLKRLKSSTKYKPSSHRPTCVGTLDCLHNLIYKKHESLTISVHDLTPIGNIALNEILPFGQRLITIRAVYN